MSYSGNISFSNGLQQCAMECALKRMNKKCKFKFGSYICNSCRYYIKNYIDAEPRQVDLFMMQAENKAAMLKNSNSPITTSLWMIAIFIVVVMVGAYSSIWYTGNKTRAPVPQQRAPVVGITAGVAQHQNIHNTLTIVSRYFNNKADVNGDRLTNCIDAAVLFYQYFPDKDKVRIMVNRHPSNGFHHMFNVIWTEGMWRAVEPQAYYGNYKSYWMRDVWPDVYEVSHNRDVTNQYIKYVR